MRNIRTTAAVVLTVLLAAGCSNATAPTASSAISQPSAGAASPVVVTPQVVAISPAVAPSSGAPGHTVTVQPAATSATPEAAVRAYLAGVAAADVTEILGASAIDEMSSKFDFSAFVARIRAMLLTTSLAPARDPFFVEINRAEQTSRILGPVRNLAYSLLSTETIDGSTISPADRARADAFSQQVDPARLAGMRVVAVRLSNPTIQKSARNLANFAAQAAIYGADEMAEWLALISFEDRLYVVGFSVFRYGSGWKVSSQVANLAGTSPLGTAKPITTEEFDRLTIPQ
jgi:hypothetical protein